MILGLYEVSHIPSISILHQYPIDFLERNENVHGVQEAGGKHTENTNPF